MNIESYLEHATVLFDNDPQVRDPAHRTAQSPPLPICGITTGKNSIGQYDGTLTKEDVIRMLDQILFNGGRCDPSEHLLIVAPGFIPPDLGLQIMYSNLMKANGYSSVLLVYSNWDDTQEHFEAGMLAKRVRTPQNLSEHSAWCGGGLKNPCTCNPKARALNKTVITAK